MTEQAQVAGGRSREVAVDLMRMALPLLDRAGEPLAAARLQHALDALESEASPPIGSAFESDFTWTLAGPRPDSFGRS